MSATSALLCAVALCLGLQDLGSVDEALEVLARGEALEGRVPEEVAREAAARIGAFTREPELDALARVALAGAARVELGRALCDVVRGQGPGDLEAARCLARLPEADRDAVLAAAPADLPGWLRTRVEACADEDASAAAEVAGAVEVFARTARPDELALALQAWADGAPAWRARVLLEHVGVARQPASVLALLAEIDVPTHLAGPLGEALAALVSRDEGAAALALEQVALGRWGAGGALLRSLGAVTVERQEAASALVVEALAALDLASEDVDDDVVSAVVTAAGELLVWQVVPALPALAADRARATRVRCAAVHALAHVGYRDAPTIDLLVALLRDPDAAVAAEAHRTLQLKAGVRLDARPALWEAWRRGQSLPEGPPESDEARLRRERELRRRVGATGR